MTSTDATSTPSPGERSDSVADITAAAAGGARWVTLGRLVVEVLAFVSTLIVARLVTPAAFGHAAVAILVNGLALAVVAQGFGSPLVQMKALHRRHLEAAFLLSLITGSLLTVAVFVGAPHLRGIFNDPTADLIQLMSPAFLFAAIGVVPQAQLQRELNFRRLSEVEIGGAIIGVMTTVGCALAGLQASSIILGLLATLCVTSAGLYLSKPGARPAWSRREAGEVLAFGLPATSASLLYEASRNVDYAILGARLDPVDVGLYYRAFQLGVDYQGKLSGVLLRIAFPVLSRAQDLDAVRQLRGRIVRLHAALLFPLLAILLATGDTLVPWLYGQPWKGAAGPAQVLAVAGMAQAIATGTGPLLLATGHPKALRNYSLVSVTVFATLVYFIAPFGIMAVAVAVTVFRIASLILTQYLLVQRLVGISAWEVLKNDVVPPALGSIGVVAVAAPLAALLNAVGTPAVVTLVASSALGLGTYGLILSRAFPDAWGDLAKLYRRLIPS